MTSHFVICVRFLDPAYHGRRDGGEAEWPPSPLRLFQALVATAARCEPLALGPSTTAALSWLEQQPFPTIVAPNAISTIGRRLSVPNNALDIVARAWSRGNESESGDADPRKHRAMKTVRPKWLMDGDAVHYIWDLPDDPVPISGHVETLRGLSRKLIVLGWGVDLVVGDGCVLSEAEVARLSGTRWDCVPSTGQSGLRVPIGGTLEDLQRRYDRFVNRLDAGVFTAPPPLSAYETVEYRTANDRPALPYAAFALRDVDDTKFRAFDSARKGLTVAGMLRHSTKLTAKASERDPVWIDRFVLGHAEQRDSKHEPVGPERFAYLPLPSIEFRGPGRGMVVGPVRRAMLTTFAASRSEDIAWARSALAAAELFEEGSNDIDAVAMLTTLSREDSVIKHYVKRASAWSTVTPVVLPGYDDPDHLRRRMSGTGWDAEQKKNGLAKVAKRIEGLLRKSMIQAGLSERLATNAIIDWRKVGFLPGVDLADRYGVPDHLKKFPRYHVRIVFCDEQSVPVEIPGPLCIGAGRYYGLGLFTAVEEPDQP